MTLFDTRYLPMLFEGHDTNPHKSLHPVHGILTGESRCTLILLWVDLERVVWWSIVPQIVANSCARDPFGVDKVIFAFDSYYPLVDCRSKCVGGMKTAKLLGSGALKLVEFDAFH